MSIGNDRVDPTPGQWFFLARRFVDAVDKIADATDLIAKVAEKRYELERNKLL